MKLVFISILLFCFIFVLAVPMKMQNDKHTFLISQEKSLEDLVSSKRHNLSLIEKSIDSLSSRSRIDAVAVKLGLGVYEVPTKITRYLK
jgi:cell division protein FtsL